MTKPYKTADIDQICTQTLRTFFNAAVASAAHFTHVDVYTPDWDNIDNDAFLTNAAFYGVKSLISNVADTDSYGNSPRSLTHVFTDNAFHFAALHYSQRQNEHSEPLRLKEVLAFAQKWAAQNAKGAYAPRLIEIPWLKTSVLWLAGEKDIFIPVAECSTRRGDPIAVDGNYLEKLRAASAEQKRVYEQARRQAIENGEDPDLIFGGARLRPPGSAKP